jgi:hypothetical protein
VSTKQANPDVAAALRRFLLWTIKPSEINEGYLERVHFVPLPPHTGGAGSNRKVTSMTARSPTTRTAASSKRGGPKFIGAFREKPIPSVGRPNRLRFTLPSSFATAARC